jgi:hypothetical protein
MKQLKSAGQAQWFLSAHDQINNLFNLRRDHATGLGRGLAHRHCHLGRTLGRVRAR